MQSVLHEALRVYVSSITELSSSSLDKLLAIFHPMSLPKDSYFAREGEMQSRIAFLNEGVIRAFYRTSTGKEYNKSFFIGPSFVGAYSALITGASNQINQQTLTSCTLLVADYKELNQLYTKFPEMERLGRRYAELAFVEKEQREIELVLFEAGERYNIFRKEYPTLENLIPQYHIASYLGITPTQLSRIRRQS